MATMPRGQPKTVPDVAGDAYDDLMRTLRGARKGVAEVFGAGLSGATRALNVVGESQLLNSAPLQWGEFGREGAGAVTDFGRNYRDMRDADWIGADKYFHCKANCEAAGRGPGGVFVGEKISNLREIEDQRIKGSPRADSLSDQEANRLGRVGGAASSAGSCSSVCSSQRPRGLPPRY